jgi:Uma2 family endonuclease
MTPTDQLQHLSSVPRLESGDRLTRAEFERRYEAMPEGVKAELVNGVVYVASPTKDLHAELHGSLVYWLKHYSRHTRGCECRNNGTLRLGPKDEPQPDALLKISKAAGGASRVGRKGYLEGPVELVAEVAASSAAHDLHDKKDAYFAHGIREYLVVVAHAREVVWFRRADQEYEPLTPGPAGVLRSNVFPGLWLDPNALLSGDCDRLIAVLDRGLHSKAHADFARELSKRAGRGRGRKT